MCGIFGILMRKDATLGTTRARALLAHLYELSESRGKESAGLHIYLPEAGRAWRFQLSCSGRAGCPRAGGAPEAARPGR